VSPAAWASDALIERVCREIFDPTLAGLAADGLDFRGVLYAGVMVDTDGVPWLLEYNCRFGDPETQPVLARMRGDLGAWLAGAANGALPEGDIEWDPRTAVCVILASEGYPASPNKGDAIHGLDEVAKLADVHVFHAGTRREDDALVTSGGRVLSVTALAGDTQAARALAYEAVSKIEFRGMQYRRDIGVRGQTEERER
jgi:phosphoribosylamine--glycine ligase